MAASQEAKRHKKGVASRDQGSVASREKQIATRDELRLARRHAARITRQLAVDYADAQCALRFASPLELLVATILSAQCTDTRVNIVTESLFAKYRTAADYAQAPLADLERAIQTTGFFRNKARNIKACCQRLVAEHGGQVPQTLDELVQLPGVGRKTANVVLGTAFGIASGVVVDTHVTRISRRLGLTAQNDAEKIERDLIAVLPRAEWIDFSHRLIHHGRRICQARGPRCDDCGLARWCPRIGVASQGATHKPTTESRRTEQVNGKQRQSKAVRSKKSVRSNKVVPVKKAVRQLASKVLH